MKNLENVRGIKVVCKNPFGYTFYGTINSSSRKDKLINTYAMIVNGEITEIKEQMWFPNEKIEIVEEFPNI